MEAHACIAKRGFESETLLANALVHMYGKCEHPKEGNHILSLIRTPKRVHPGYSFIDYVGSAG